jgi:RNA polymerase sigma factor (sigma-70 family)
VHAYPPLWPPLSDEALLAGFASRDPEAGAAFARRFQGRVFGLSVAILGNRSEAEEAAQDTFLRAFRHADDYDARRGTVAAWLLTIARNVAIDHSRLRRAEPLDPAALLELETVAPDAGPDERCIAAGEAARLREAIAMLPDEQRRALVLAAFLGRTAREIGAIERVPQGTIKTRIRAAMLKLRALLEVGDA